jgi:hypothetical protein
MGRMADVRERIQKLLVTGDNRLKQGARPEKIRESYEQALALAREAGLEDRIRLLVEIRLADLDAAEAASRSEERSRGQSPLDL